MHVPTPYEKNCRFSLESNLVPIYRSRDTLPYNFFQDTFAVFPQSSASMSKNIASQTCRDL